MCACIYVCMYSLTVQFKAPNSNSLEEQKINSLNVDQSSEDIHFFNELRGITVKPVLRGHPRGMLWCPLKVHMTPNFVPLFFVV